jgi:glycosyltransferase involved in cell wall biosynthesis
MKIGIDIQTTLGNKTGFGFYVENLVEQLKKINGGYEYSLIRPDIEQDFSAPKRFLWDQFGVPKQARAEKVDLLHQPSFSAPVFFGGRTVVTIHDLIAVHFGEDIPFWSRQYFGRWMPFSYNFVDHIIAVSNHTKKDIIDLLHTPEDKITVIYEAADTKFKPLPDKASQAKRIKEKYKIKDDFILHVGTLNPRKNLEFLVSVYSEVVKKFPNTNLVIAGKKGWYYESLIEKVNSLDLGKKVLFIGYIDEEDKVAMYNAATMLVFPSLYEGFGLPPLEAMSCGVPVVASNRSSIPEVVGEGGLLIDPTDIKAWTDGICLFLKSPKDREKYGQYGIKQASKFSWSKTAQETISVYDKVLKGNK